MAKRVAKKTPAKIDVTTALSELKRHASKATRDGLARYGIPAENALGVAMRAIQLLAKELGPNHDLAVALWDCGVYEARLLVAYVGEPARLTSAQMDRWVAECDNWAVVDTLCFSLFNRTPLAWEKIEAWAGRSEEFVRRAAFALLACLVRSKEADDEMFRRTLPLIERAATDERNFVKKAVNWALRMIGERSAGLNTAVLKVAQRLAKSESAAARWVGQDAIKQLAKPAVLRRLAARAKK